MPDSEKKIVELDEFLELQPALQNKKLVFTNGCFDLIHPGHVDYLEKAKKLGEILIVGLNTDDSIQKLKGKGRPINNFLFRSRILAGLTSVDFIIPFKEETPLSLIKKICPEILVKGDDYEKEKIVGFQEVIEMGGEVKTLPFLPGYSTTTLINKIRNNDHSEHS